MESESLGVEAGGGAHGLDNVNNFNGETDCITIVAIDNNNKCENIAE